jgi:hypothetical protein
VEVRHITQYLEPGFPTHQILDEHPELLALVPKRWRANPAVLTALASLCLLVSSHRSSAADQAAPSKVAPIFLHGDGRGSLGCIAVNPPVFLSEAEARTIIVEEAKRAGIGFTADGRVLEGIAVPITDDNGRIRDDGEIADANGSGAVSEVTPSGEIHFSTRPEKGAVRVMPLTLDGADNQRKVYYEFVSESDYRDWKRKGGPISTARSYNTLDTAKVLRTGLEKAQHTGAYAVFYDPCVGWRNARKKLGNQATHDAITAAAKDLSHEELRRQVQDFIKWLKAEGVI